MTNIGTGGVDILLPPLCQQTGVVETVTGVVGVPVVDEDTVGGPPLPPTQGVPRHSHHLIDHVDEAEITIVRPLLVDALHVAAVVAKIRVGK